MPPARRRLAGFPPSVSSSSHAVEAEGWVHLTGQLGRELDDPAAPLPEGCAALALGAVVKIEAVAHRD